MPGGRIHYWRMGDGPRLLILLHGFADSGLIFERLVPMLGHHYTVLAPDLPWHGQTHWQARATWSARQLAELISDLLAREQVRHYELGGFSMGGRMLMSALPLIEVKPIRLWLLAPDGLGTRWVALLDHVPLWLRQWLKWCMDRPVALLALARLLHQVGLLDRWTWTFLRYQFHTEPRRRRLHATWCALAHFPVGWRWIAAALQPIVRRTTLVVGQYDPLVSPRAVGRFAHRLPALEVVWLPVGHDDFLGPALGQWWRTRLESYPQL